jgi:hypothetical protein
MSLDRARIAELHRNAMRRAHEAGETADPNLARQLYECAELFLGLVNFLEWDLDSTRLSVEDLTRSWQSFLQRRQAEPDKERELCNAVQD